MKKFICVSPHQDPKRLGANVYEPNTPNLSYSETAFPIMPVINAYAEKGDKIEIITVVSEYENAEKNYERFMAEVQALSEKKGFEIVNKEKSKVSLPYIDDTDTYLDMFSMLIDHMSDEDTLYADMTYGTKVMTMALNMALNYGYRINKDVLLGCIVYGKVDHNTHKANIYDITSLNYMDEIVRVMADAKVRDPKEQIKNLLM